jgi:hypothetical protein
MYTPAVSLPSLQIPAQEIPIIALAASRFVYARESWQSCGSSIRRVLVAHTGQSSQLFPVAIGRNAQFLATGETGLVMASNIEWSARYVAPWAVHAALS